MVWGILFLIDIHTLCLSNKGHIQKLGLYKYCHSSVCYFKLSRWSWQGETATKDKHNGSAETDFTFPACDVCHYNVCRYSHRAHGVLISCMSFSVLWVLCDLVSTLALAEEAGLPDLTCCWNIKDVSLDVKPIASPPLAYWENNPQKQWKI